MAARNSIIKVSVIGDVDQLRKSFSETATGAEKWSSRMASAGKAMTVGLTLPIVAGAGMAIKAAQEEGAEIEALADTIRKRIPGATEELVQSNEDWVSNLQGSIAVADSEIRGLEQTFIAAGASVEEAQKLTELAYDTAAQTGKDATTVANAFAKGINGNVGALGRLNIATKDAAGETKSFEEIVSDLEEKMGGSAAAAADTSAGRAEKLKLSMADLAETIGTLLLPLVEKLVGWGQQLADWFNNLDPAGQKLVTMLLGVVAAIGPLLIVGAKVVQSFQTIMTAFKALNLAFMTNPWFLLIAATVALVVLIVQNWDKIKAFLDATWAWIKKAAKTTWDWIKNAIKTAVDFIVNLFLNWTLPGLIFKHWEKIKKGVETVKGWIIGTWESILSFFREMPKKISSAASGMWNGIKDAFRGAINWIIDKWNALSFTVGPLTVPSWIPGIGGKQIKLTLSTPNIPRFHDGGVFRAPGGLREGLALLKDRETVLPAGARGGGDSYSIVVHAGIGTDGVQVGRAIVQELQRYQRANGPIPVAVRG